LGAADQPTRRTLACVRCLRSAAGGDDTLDVGVAALLLQLEERALAARTVEAGKDSGRRRRCATGAQERVAGSVGRGLAWYLLESLARRSLLPDAIAQRGTLPAP
jgi:hypothetical protein